MPEHKVPQTFRIKPELARAMDHYCQAKDRTKTDTIEKALSKFLHSRKEFITGLQEILDDED